jgi:hypothetical protein
MQGLCIVMIGVVIDCIYACVSVGQIATCVVFAVLGVVNLIVLCVISKKEKTGKAIVEKKQ